MQIFANPGSTTHAADDKGRTVHEVRIELADRRPGEPADVEHGVILHVSEYRGMLLVSVTYGDPDWRPAVDRRTNKRPKDPLLVVESVLIPDGGRD